MAYRYRQPGNEDDFERFCLTLMREHWSSATLDRYGHRGERQHGVDLLDTSGAGPLRAVQCKHHAVHKTLPPAELLAEVELAKTFSGCLGEYYVLTTAKKSTHAQDAVTAFNRDPKKPFTVRLLTWDDIEDIIDDCPTAQDALGVQGPQVTRKLLREQLAPVQGLLRAQEGNIHSSDLDEIKRTLDLRDVHLAKALLTRIRLRAWSEMADGNRHRWCVLAADTEFRHGKTHRAAQLLIEAKTYQPDDVKAAANEVIALDMLGDKALATSKADAAITKYPQFGVVYAAAIRVAQDPPALSSIVHRIPQYLRNDAAVCVALASRVDLQPSAQIAEEHARQATRVAPDEAESWYALGVSLLQLAAAEDESKNLNSTGAVRSSRELLQEALTCCETSLRLADGHTHPGFVAHAHLRTAVCHSRLGDSQSAQQSLNNALELAPEDPFVVMVFCENEAASGNHTVAIDRLRHVVMRDPRHEARGLLAIILWERNGAGDRDEATQLALTATLDSDVHIEALSELMVEGLAIHSRYAEARAHLEKLKPRLDACLVDTLQARLSWKQGLVDDARQLATQARSSATEQTSSDTSRRLARLLTTLGHDPQALEIWETLAARCQLNNDGLEYVACAARLKQHAKVLDYCRAARSSDLFDDCVFRPDPIGVPMAFDR